MPKQKRKPLKSKTSADPGYFKSGEAIVFDPPVFNVEKYPGYPLRRNEVVYYLTDIPNKPTHCIIVTDKGALIPMMHPGDFRKAKDKEI